MSFKSAIDLIHDHLDFEVLCGWYHLHKQPLPLKEDIPQLAWVVKIEDQPIATAYLRICEGNFGMLDGLITNPYSSSHERSFAIDLLTETILEAAFMRKMKHVLALSYSPNILKRSKKYGFIELPHHVILKPLFERY